jgi:hypothetical protein
MTDAVAYWLMVEPARNPDRRPADRTAVSGGGTDTGAGADDCGGDGAVPPQASGAFPCASCAQSNVGSAAEQSTMTS